MKPAPEQPDNYAAERSPVYRAVWEESAVNSPEVFQAASDPPPADVQKTMQRCREVLLLHREQNTLRGPNGKHSAEVLTALGAAGYWGLLVERDYGGSGCDLRHFLPFLTQTAVIDAPLAGLAAVHGCIGAVDPLQTFGTAEQKRKYLPALASGERLSAFASTEPGAGSDLRAIQTMAIRSADGWLLSGQKAFITNLAAGRTIGLLCKVEEQLAVIVTNLPDRETEQFELIPNRLHPLKHTHNSGLRLRDLPVAADSLLTPPAGKDGRAIVFHGLNRGRAAICALAAGHLRVLLAGMIAWAKQRTVHGKKLAEIELIQARCARVAALIAGCDALAKWCGSLLDAGYRGEVECIIAKVFASEAVKHAAFDLALPTHGGRFFLQGHAAGDMAYDYLAPCIYEGENELLLLAMFHALQKGLQSLPPEVQKGWQEFPTRNLDQRMFARALMFRNQPQAQMVSTSRSISKTMITRVIMHSGWEEMSEMSQLALKLLRVQLERGGGGHREDAELELRLGAQLMEQPLPWLQDVRPFVDPLPI
jgi:alkylation response protein AidB-like acyl-CoA dehydrogenase